MKNLDDAAREMLSEAGIKENPRTLIVAREVVLMKLRLEDQGYDWDEVKRHLFAKIRELQANQDAMDSKNQKIKWN